MSRGPLARKPTDAQSETAPETVALRVTAQPTCQLVKTTMPAPRALAAPVAVEEIAH